MPNRLLGTELKERPEVRERTEMYHEHVSVTSVSNEQNLGLGVNMDTTVIFFSLYSCVHLFSEVYFAHIQWRTK